MATSTDLNEAIDEVQGALLEGRAIATGTGEEAIADAPGLVRELAQRLGALPWWMISVVTHAILILLFVTFFAAARMMTVGSDDLFVTSEFTEPEEPEVDMEKPRDLFKNLVDAPTEVAVEQPILPHDDPDAEVSDHFETDNDMDTATARGDENAFSTVPLGGTGVVGTMGVGGGGPAGVYGFRSGGGRKKCVMRYGGSKQTESAVEAALKWLADHQEADGHWDARKHEGGGNVSGGRIVSDVSVSALATLAFLGAGYTHKTAGKYRDNVARAVTWLRAQQLESGAFVRDGSGYQVYDHCIGTLALAEAYGMTRDAELRPVAQKGVDYVIEIQEPYSGWHHGSFRSTSVLGWAVMALKSARMAGLSVDGRGFQGAMNRLDEVTDPDSGKVGYCRRGQSSFGRGFVMTGVGMVSRFFMGAERDEPMLAKGAGLLLTDVPQWKARCSVRDVQYFYHWYYGTLALFQMGGERWKKWNEGLKSTLLPNQRTDGDANGSWDPDAGWAPTGGRVYSTAMGALCLEVYYRYLPMYRD